MRFLVVTCFLIGVAVALPQRRPYDQQSNEYPENPDVARNHQPQHQQQHSPQQHPQQQQQQNYEPSRPRHESTTYIPIIRFDKEQGSDGSYKTAWETGNHIIAEEEGFLKGLGPDPDNNNEEIQAQVQHGSYSYTSPEGQLITVHYTADEFGFRPSGDHLPTPPPVSPEVQKGLDLIYAGIKAQQEAAARDPEGHRKDENFNNSGQYRP